MKLLTNVSARELDRRTQDELGIAGYALMRSAGCALAGRIVSEFADVSRWCVVCGKGNNGGDGLVAAAELAFCHGRAVDVVLMEDASLFRGEALEAWTELNGRLSRTVSSKLRICSASELDGMLRGAGGVVEAMFGVGLRAAPEGKYAEAIELINAARRGPVVAVDIPGGIGGGGPVVRADLTVTFGRPKRDLVMLPGALFAGRIAVEPIQFPEVLLDAPEICENWLAPEELAAWMPVRLPVANKGTFGKLMLACGCASYAGAAIFATMAALRMGTGLVTLATVRDLNGVYKIAVPEACTLIVPSDDQDGFDVLSAPVLVAATDSCTALVLGCGLGQTVGRGAFVSEVLARVAKPTVIDADALNALSLADVARIVAARPVGAQWVMTPHPGEAARLLGCDVAMVQADRVESARRLAARWGATVLLKGAGTVVADADGQVWYDGFASSVLSRGGTGDVLAGIIGGLLAQGVPPTRAAVLGTRLLGMAGTLAGSVHGERGVLTREIAAALAKIG